MSELGIIFHLGLYSVYAYDNPKSAKMRQIKNGSEWYLNRITYTSFRGSKSEIDAKKYHKDNFNDQDYYLAENSFTLKNLNFDEWIEFVKSIGFSYVILTAKHHDGYCLWDTKTTEHNCCSENSVVNINGNKNIVKLFIDAARKHNLEVGLYYSFFEFLKSPTKQYIKDIMIPQMDELIEYNVDRWFFDGNWPMKSLHSNTAIKKICEKILLKNPNCKINDRLENSKLYLDKNYLGLSTYRTYSDREIPDKKPEVPWEHINTIGLSWGINKQQKVEDFKTGDQLFQLYQQVKDKGGNFLINMGPDCDGTLQIEEKNALLEFKKIREN